MRWSNRNISRFYCSKTANVFIAYLLSLRRHKYLPCESVSVQTMRVKAILKFIWHVFPANILIMLWPLRIDARIDMWLFLCFAASSAYFWGTVMQAKYMSPCNHKNSRKNHTETHEQNVQLGNGNRNMNSHNERNCKLLPPKIRRHWDKKSSYGNKNEEEIEKYDEVKT